MESKLNQNESKNRTKLDSKEAQNQNGIETELKYILNRVRLESKQNEIRF